MSASNRAKRQTRWRTGVEPFMTRLADQLSSGKSVAAIWQHVHVPYPAAAEAA